MSKEFIYTKSNQSILNVPATILHHFGIKTNKTYLPEEFTSNLKDSSNLVLFFIDGMGFNIFEKFANKNFFKTFKDKGEINKITSTFPPTTAAALTTLHTGLAPIEHGFFEWNLYMPSYEEIIESLRYKIVATEFTDTNMKLPLNASSIFNGKTIYNTLKENQVDSVMFLPEEISSSFYTQVISKNATIISYKDLSDLLLKLVFTLERSKSQLFCNVYWVGVDDAEHAYGVWTDETKNEIEKLSLYLEKNFLKRLTLDTAKDTGIFFTADHGLVDIDLENPTLLNDHSYITDRYERNSKGNPILPSGSPRDIFLHVKQDKVNEVISYLERELSNKSAVLKLDEQKIKQLFGDYLPHKEFLERLGNVLILSKGNHVCWYKYNNEKKLVLKGHHGSLLEGEMIIPFGSAKASDLI